MPTYLASWLFTPDRDPIQNAVLQVDEGRVVYSGPWSGQTIDVDLTPSLLVPGFANAHTHLDLGAMRGKLSPPLRFTDWLLQVIAYRRQGDIREWDVSIQNGITESLAAGTTALGDISVGGRSWPFLLQSRLRFVRFLELLGLSHERTDGALQLLRDDLAECPHRDEHRRAYSPHAPYSVSQRLLEELVEQLSAFPHISVAMHFAEFLEESHLLQERAGPFEHFLQQLEAWHPDNLCHSPDQVLDLLNRLEAPLLIHGNYLTNDLWRRLPPGASVVYCPRTHDFFGHPPHPFREMIADGVNLALGTDSLASNPDLSILNECRFLWRQDHLNLHGATLLRMATVNGYQALGLKHALPTLQTGSPADFVVIPCEPTCEDPWDALFASDTVPTATFIDGAQVRP